MNNPNKESRNQESLGRSEANTSVTRNKTLNINQSLLNTLHFKERTM
jgi:hypothetical protein